MNIKKDDLLTCGMVYILSYVIEKNIDKNIWINGKLLSDKNQECYVVIDNISEKDINLYTIELEHNMRGIE